MSKLKCLLVIKVCLFWQAESVCLACFTCQFVCRFACLMICLSIRLLLFVVLSVLTFHCLSVFPGPIIPSFCLLICIIFDVLYIFIIFEGDQSASADGVRPPVCKISNKELRRAVYHHERDRRTVSGLRVHAFTRQAFFSSFAVGLAIGSILAIILKILKDLTFRIIR